MGPVLQQYNIDMQSCKELKAAVSLAHASLTSTGTDSYLGKWYKYKAYRQNHRRFFAPQEIFLQHRHSTFRNEAILKAHLETSRQT